MRRLGAEAVTDSDEIAPLRQAIWDAYGILGFDRDGDPTPDALVYPSLGDLIRQAATEQRKDYDDALSEIERLRSLLGDLLVDCENWGCAPADRYAEALS